MMIDIPPDVVQRLAQLAEQQGSTIGDLLLMLLERYAPEAPPGSLAEMARNARAANLASRQPVNTAERSREILRAEYADYLKRRLKNDDPGR
jgi:hypothetical protein